MRKIKMAKPTDEELDSLLKQGPTGDRVGKKALVDALKALRDSAAEQFVQLDGDQRAMLGAFADRLVHVPTVFALRQKEVDFAPKHVWLDEYALDTNNGAGILLLDPDDRTTADNGGTVFITRAGSRYKRPNSRNISVTDFGAVGDNKANDSMAFQRALDYAAAARIPTVSIPDPPVRFRVSGVRINSGVTLVGPHANAHLYDPIDNRSNPIRTKPTVGAAESGPIFVVGGLRELRTPNSGLTNLTLIGGGEALETEGVIFDNCMNGVLTNVFFRSFSGSAARWINGCLNCLIQNITAFQCLLTPKKTQRAVFEVAGTDHFIDKVVGTGAQFNDGPSWVTPRQGRLQLSNVRFLKLDGADHAEDDEYTDAYLYITSGSHTGAVRQIKTNLNREKLLEIYSPLYPPPPYDSQYKIYSMNKLGIIFDTTASFITNCYGDLCDVGIYFRSGALNLVSNVRADLNQGPGIIFGRMGGTYTNLQSFNNSKSGSGEHDAFLILYQSNVIASNLRATALADVPEKHRYGFNDNHTSDNNKNSFFGSVSTGHEKEPYRTEISGGSAFDWPMGPWKVLASDSEQPSVASYKCFTTRNTRETNIINFIDGANGQAVEIYCADNFTTFINSSNLLQLQGGANVYARQGTFYRFVMQGSVWRQIF